MKHMHGIVLSSILCLHGALLSNSKQKKAHPKTNIIIDHRLSKKTKTALRSYIHTHQKKNIKKGDFVYLLVNQFPFISDVHVRKDAKGNQLYSLFSVNPLIRINNQLLFTDKKTIIPQSIFESHIVENLNNISISNYKGPSCLQSDHLCNLIQHIPYQLFENYVIEYVDQTRSFLRDKKDNECLISFNESTIPTISIVADCKKIKDELLFNSTQKNKSKKTYVADVRFKDQIIMRSVMGG